MPSPERYEEVLATLQLLFAPDQVIEVRAIGDDGISSGYFNDLKTATNELLIRDNDPRVSGVYVTLNEVRPDLLARRANRLKFRVGRKDALTADADIIRRRWLPIDIDPVRPSGISSSASERSDALALADTIASFLHTLGWDDPIIADSGNGAHLVYPIDLPNDDHSRTLIRQVLEFLDMRFSDARCKVDTANFNASRIWKVYGTTSRKGDHLPDRPHRRSRILSLPGTRTVICQDMLSTLVSLYQSPPEADPEQAAIRARTGQGAVLDLGAWLTSHDIGARAKPYQGGTVYVLDVCPFSTAHTDGAFAIQFANGAIFAGCHHDSCGGGRQRWSELRSRFEPDRPDIGNRLARLRSSRIRERERQDEDYRDRTGTDSSDISGASPEQFCRQPGDHAIYHPLHRDTRDDTRHDTHQSTPYDASCSPDHPDFTPDEERADNGGDSMPNQRDEIRMQAEEILSTGNPLTYLLETFATAHEGDQTVAECLIHSFLSRSVINSKGLHVSITGESGKGKSHAIDTMLTLIPPAFRLDGRLSDKALFYIDDLVPGTVITLDDISLSDQMQEVLKGVTTSFQKPFLYRSVNKDRKGQVYTIPERCVWWMAKVEGTGDDQIFNRMLTCWIDDSEDQDLKVLDRTLSGAELMPGTVDPENEQARVCRQIWTELSPVWVVIPYARRIRFQSAENRRNPDMLLDLIRTNAALNQRKREMRYVDGICCVVADIEDFEQASRLFIALNGETGSQRNKLTRREAALIEKMAAMSHGEITIAHLQRATGWSNGSVSKLLNGYQSYGKSYSGLLEKCPALSILDRTISRGDDGYTTMRRSKVYLWDPMIYEAWMKGGCVWLEPERKSPDGDDEGPDQGSGSERSEHEHPDSLIADTRQKQESGTEPGTGGSQAHSKSYPHTAMDSEMHSPSLYQDLALLPKIPDESDDGGDQDCRDLKSDLNAAKGPGDPTRMDGADTPPISLALVNPQEYFLLDGVFDRRRCSVCGKKPIRYQERMTSKRLVENPRMNHTLCQGCYQRAVSLQAASIIPLPGVIDTSQMIRRDVSIGQCHVCNLKPAVWSDRENQVHICDFCYERESGSEKQDRCQVPDEAD